MLVFDGKGDAHGVEGFGDGFDKDVHVVGVESPDGADAEGVGLSGFAGVDEQIAFRQELVELYPINEHPNYTVEVVIFVGWRAKGRDDAALDLGPEIELEAEGGHRLANYPTH
jgi:hypothetical protein